MFLVYKIVFYTIPFVYFNSHILITFFLSEIDTTNIKEAKSKLGLLKSKIKTQETKVD